MSIERSSCKECHQSHHCIAAKLSEAVRGNKVKDISRHEAIYVRGQRIFSQSACSSACYIVKSGSVKIVNVDAQGNERIIGFYLPGEVFGWEGVFRGSFPSTAIAMERSMVCKIPIEYLEQRASAKPDFIHSLLKLMSRELNNVEQLAIRLTRYTAEERIISFLLDLSQRYADRKLSALYFRLPMNRTDIANHLGLAVETVSRVLGRIQHDGDLTIRGRELKILNHSRLLSKISVAPNTEIRYISEENKTKVLELDPKCLSGTSF
ncbi:hypothetical protein BKP64_06240 [Marinobacter salinus]|uniref:Crp/Fnr family transcriptional regulator n=1 Tax=Marinobacter salinus TaxID=1874317 RepID=A0A1D9GJI7_9GAMM|nr:cyclic nucleotide-binding domain-containing protein [Marinobacter salinus]AOY87802.1 hypothetical protein BKP64_06240 [Marinobacter salinus]